MIRCGEIRGRVIWARRAELAAAVWPPLPDRYSPDLATSLSALGDVLSALGRATDADAAWREANELA